MQHILKSKYVLPIAAVIAVSTAFSVSQLNAQNTTNDTEKSNSRFQLEREGDGFVRIDRKTGETSYCRRVNSSLICKLAIEEREGFHDEIASLQSQLGSAKEKLDAIGEKDPDRPHADIPDPKTHDDAGSERDKIERELDQALEITKFTVRKLFGLVKELQKEYGD